VARAGLRVLVEEGMIENAAVQGKLSNEVTHGTPPDASLRPVIQNLKRGQTFVADKMIKS
jgi:hypothetical protein